MAKKTRNFKRPTLGDVIEIPLSGARRAYAQLTHDHREPPTWGQLLRVLPGVFDAPIRDVGELISQPERFYTFFPVGSAVRQGLVRIVANEEIPDRCRPFPLFKACNRNLGTGRPTTWFLWDGQTTTEIGVKLPRKYHHLPMKQLINLPLLVERIEIGWSPRDEV
jgi:hypothetical protein